jgi:hypothetical protein
MCPTYLHELGHVLLELREIRRVVQVGMEMLRGNREQRKHVEAEQGEQRSS